ncbi:hypothetical protein QQ045_026565 [Rhodiola kirilowii]
MLLIDFSSSHKPLPSKSTSSPLGIALAPGVLNALVMDRSNSNGEDFAVDIESGRSGREEDRSVHGDYRASLCGALVNYDADLVENVVIDVKLEGMDADEKKSVKENK